MPEVRVKIGPRSPREAMENLSDKQLTTLAAKEGCDRLNAIASYPHVYNFVGSGLGTIFPYGRIYHWTVDTNDKTGEGTPHRKYLPEEIEEKEFLKLGLKVVGRDRHASEDFGTRTLIFLIPVSTWQTLEAQAHPRPKPRTTG